MGLAQGWFRLSETKFCSPWTLDYLLISKTEQLIGTRALVAGLPRLKLGAWLVNYIPYKTKQSTAGWYLKSPWSLSSRSLHLILVLCHQKKTSMVINDWLTYLLCPWSQSALPFLRYGYFEIWPWRSMVKARAGVKYVLANTNTNTNTFFSEFQIQIQIQIHRQKSDQIQIQIQIQPIKLKYKYKYKYTLRPRQNWRHFTDDILKFILL